VKTMSNNGGLEQDSELGENRPLLRGNNNNQQGQGREENVEDGNQNIQPSQNVDSNLEDVDIIILENQEKKADALATLQKIKDFTIGEDAEILTEQLLMKRCSFAELQVLEEHLNVFAGSNSGVGELYLTAQALISNNLLSKAVEKLERIHTMSTRAVIAVMILLVLSFGVGVGALWLGQAYPFNFANKEATLFKVIALVGIPLVLVALIAAIWTYWAMFLEPQKTVKVAAKKMTRNKAVYCCLGFGCVSWSLWFVGVMMILVYVYIASGMYITGSYYADNPSAKFWNLLYSEIWWVLPIAIYGVSFVIWLLVFMFLSYRVRLSVKAEEERLLELDKSQQNIVV